MSALVIIVLQVALTGLPQDIAEGCRGEGGTVALASCYSERTNGWEKRLDQAYPAALSHTKGQQRVALERAQGVWVRYRNASCRFYKLEDGSVHFIWGAYCMLDLTRRRALELEEYVQP